MKKNSFNKNDKIITSTLKELSLISKFLLKKGEKKRIWLFEGEMGAGKTTLIKSICRDLGVKNIVTSPTFSIINEYITSNGEKVYHFDLFRINSIDEAYEIGIEDYLNSGYYCLIEWPSKLKNFFKNDYFKISIKVINQNTRELYLSTID